MSNVFGRCCQVCEDAEIKDRGGVFTHRGMFIVCKTCGNKRCPRASAHWQDCTNSNEPGQPGSFYGPEESWPRRS